MVAKGTLRLRFQRWGSKKNPVFRIVVADKYSRRDGKFIERVGRYHVTPDKFGEKVVAMDVDRIKYWLAIGATPTSGVRGLLGICGLLPRVPRPYRTVSLIPRAERGQKSSFHTMSEPMQNAMANNSALGRASFTGRGTTASSSLNMTTAPGMSLPSAFRTKVMSR